MQINLQFECEAENLSDMFQVDSLLPTPNLGDSLYVWDHEYTVIDKMYSYDTTNDGLRAIGLDIDIRLSRVV